ncbi:MAG: hypothetical protein QOC81_339 [Thermoanaerobaculia bacterium]|jgi:hypothetical protein|nr:hypothetical protein [Thermoanaerobaculia bacterium]
MTDSHHAEIVEVVDRPVSISHLTHTLQAYGPAIFLSTAAIAVLYLILSVAIYVLSPTQRISSQQFRLDFEGASEAKYPNGIKFSSSDITSTPILLKVFQDNQLDRFTSFPNFSRSLVVLESNADYERLAAEYQARLADPKQSAIDRERVLRDWQAKASSIAKNDFSLNWFRTRDTAAVPESVVKKVLLDTLSSWARYAANEQHVLKYRLTVFSPEMIGSADTDSEPIVAIQVLRSKIYKVLQNIDALREVPGSELVRGPDGMNLDEIRLRLEEIIRFHLDPLTGRVSTTGLIANRPATLRFLESQLAYDQRHMKATQDYADVIRQSFAVYSLDQRGFSPDSVTAAAATAAAPPNQQHPQQQRSDTLMPQIGDSFLDRLLTLTSQSSDIQYRQKVADEYRRASEAVIPAQQSVAYDQEVLVQVRSSATAPIAGEADGVRNEIIATKNEVKQLLGRVNHIYDAVSANLNPSKELYTLTAPSVVRTEHSRSLFQLALYGVAVIALSLIVIIILCLIHARIREEEAAETHSSEALRTDGQP